MDHKLREALTTGRELYKQREFVRAEPHLVLVTAAQLPYADVYNMLGVIYHDVGQFSKAQAAFEEALRNNPAYTEASLNLAVTYNDMGRYAEARDLYMGALTTSTKPGGKLDSFVMGKLANMYADIAEVFASSGCFDEAIAEYRRALGLCPMFIDLRLRLALALRDGGEGEASLRELRAILTQNAEYLPARLNLGLALFATGDHAAAIKELEVILAVHPENPRAKLYRDMILEHQSRKKT